MSGKNPLLRKIGLALLAYAVIEGIKIAITEQHELSSNTENSKTAQRLPITPLGFDSPIAKQRFSLEYNGVEVYSKNQCGISPNSHIGVMTGEFAQLSDGRNIIEVKDNHGIKRWRLASSIKTI